MADIEIPSWELPSWDQLDGMVDTDPIGLRDLAARMARELADRPTLAPDARERLARHLYVTTTMSGMEWDDLGEECQDVYRRRADKALAVITGKEG